MALERDAHAGSHHEVFDDEGHGGEAHAQGDDAEVSQSERQVVGVFSRGTAREAAKGPAEGQVANDVEDGPAEPGFEVRWLVLGRRLGELGEERVDVRLDQGLLLVQSFVGEGVRDELADARVVGVVGR